MIELQEKSYIINYDEVVHFERDCRNPLPVDGKFVSGTPIRFHKNGNVQPLQQRDLLLLPEGDRHKEQLYVWVQDHDNERILINDRVVRLGACYQVQSTDNWGDYTRARIMRIDIGPESGGNT